MGLISYKLGQTGIVLRVVIQDSSSTTGAALTGLTYSSTGLVIAECADNENTASGNYGYYTAADSTIESITTLGTYEAPSSTAGNNVGVKARFKAVTGFGGLYEIHLANARYAVSNAKYLVLLITGATNMVPVWVMIPLTRIDPYDSVRAGLTALPNDTAGGTNGLPINSGAWVPGTIAVDDTFTVGGATPEANVVKVAGQTASATGTINFDDIATLKNLAQSGGRS